MRNGRPQFARVKFVAQMGLLARGRWPRMTVLALACLALVIYGFLALFEGRVSNQYRLLPFVPIWLWACVPAIYLLLRGGTDWRLVHRPVWIDWGTWISIMVALVLAGVVLSRT